MLLDHLQLLGFAALFDTPPNCVTFSDVFHRTLFTWLVHHSFSFSGIILADWPCTLLMFCISFHYSSCTYILLPPLPNTTETSPFDCPIMYWPLILLHPLLSSFSLVFLVCHTIYMDLSLTWMTFSDHFWIPYHYIYALILPLFTARDRLSSSRTLSSLYCGVCSVVVQTI